MKKTYQYEKKYYYPHLYREDLEEIQEVITSLKPDYFRISGDNFETKEIKEVPIDTVTERLSFRGGSIYLAFATWGSYLSNTEDDLETLGAVTKINSIIEKRENKFRYYLKPLNSVFIVFTIVINFFFRDFINNKIELIIFLVSQLILVCCSFFYIYTKNAKIEFDYYKNKKRNFFHRNKENIINQIIGGLVVAIILGLYHFFIQ